MDFEEIRGVQRKEKSVSGIVEVSGSYYSDLAGFIKSGTDEYKRTSDSSRFRALDNVIKLARDVFDKREQKIVMKALRSVRTGDIDDGHMTPEEKVLFRSLVNSLKSHQEFFNRVVLGEYAPPEEVMLLNGGGNNIVLVRVRSKIPQFVGDDSAEYGPFEVSDVVKLPRKDAELLSQQNLVEIM
ncbi:MAG: DNA replication complex GINS family protein [Candidatus Diapherotrites archaeon]|nr:DNA replication complex GINS family protein [Candidatus Diapherotrites archaeon]